MSKHLPQKHGLFLQGVDSDLRSEKCSLVDKHEMVVEALEKVPCELQVVLG